MKLSQLRNFIAVVEAGAVRRAAVNLNLQVAIADANGQNYGMAMAIVVATVAIVIFLMVAFGPEKRGVAMSEAHQRAGGMSPQAT